MRPLPWMASVAEAEPTTTATPFEVLVKELLEAQDLDVAAAAKVDSFDYSFMSQLMQKVQAATDPHVRESEREQHRYLPITFTRAKSLSPDHGCHGSCASPHQFVQLSSLEVLCLLFSPLPRPQEIESLNRVGVAANTALQQRLARADQILRKILKSGDLKLMEATLRKHLRAGELDMAFDVVLNVNIQQADETETETASQLLKHLSTVLMEEREKRLPVEVRFLRRLLRCDGGDGRKELLRKEFMAPPPEVVEEDGEEGQAAAKREKVRVHWSRAIVGVRCTSCRGG